MKAKKEKRAKSREYDPVIENQLKHLYGSAKDLEIAGILVKGFSSKIGKRLNDYNGGRY